MINVCKGQWRGTGGGAGHVMGVRGVKSMLSTQMQLNSYLKLEQRFG